MLLHVSPSLGQKSQGASRSLLRLLLAFLFVKHLLSIDVLALPSGRPSASSSVDLPASLPIKDGKIISDDVSSTSIDHIVFLEIWLYGSRTAQGNMKVQLSINQEEFCADKERKCPLPLNATSVFLGHAYFVDTDTRARTFDRAHQAAMEAPLSEGAYGSWEYVHEFLINLSLASSGMKEPPTSLVKRTLDSFRLKLKNAEVPTGIDLENWNRWREDDEETQVSWKPITENVSLDEYGTRSDGRRTGTVILSVGTEPYRSDTKSLERLRKMPSACFDIDVTFTNNRSRDAFRNQVGKLLEDLKRLPRYTHITWEKQLKADFAELDLGPGKAGRTSYLKDWAFDHQVVKLLAVTDPKIMAIWKSKASPSLRALATQKRNARNWWRNAHGRKEGRKVHGSIRRWGPTAEQLGPAVNTAASSSCKEMVDCSMSRG
ncbi:hypothetical protein C8R42DRAFT_80299 [Lentinula raphanica]|nr:hypothetical protein C8R42DRAFT_80299 [Lentinula raphanica]